MLPSVTVALPQRARCGAQARVALRAVGDDEEAADRGGDLEVLDRVADGDAVGGVVAAGAGVGGDGGALADQAGDQVVAVGAALDGRHRPADGAVVEQAQVVVAVLAEQGVGLVDVDLAAEEVGEDAAGVPGLVVLEPPFEVLEQQLRDAAPLDLLVDRADLVRAHLAGHQRRLAIDREGAAGLVDVGGLADQPRRLVDLGLAAAGHDHDLGPGPLAGLEPARLGQREAALGVAEERGPGAEQGAVEVGVDAAESHGSRSLR